MLFVQSPASPVSSELQAPRYLAKTAYFLLLAALLFGELIHFGLPVLYTLNPNLQGWWWPLIWNARSIVEAAIGAAIAIVFFSWQDFQSKVRAAIREPLSSGQIRWLLAHVVCALGVLGWLTIGRFDFSPAYGALWFFGGMSILLGSVVSWCLALFPAEFWSSWFKHNPRAFAAGLAVGALTRLVGYLSQVLLYPLQQYTLLTVAVILHLLGQSPVEDASLGLVGTVHFSAQIASTCSGLEGIGLICAFLSFYLWYFRAELRFPAVLALIPVGIVAIWILNAVRITLLILLGAYLQRTALEGFHSVAGWILFNATAIGLIVVSRRVRLFSKIEPAADKSASNPAAPYLVPLAVMSALALLSEPFSRGFDFAYPVRMIATAAVIWCYRNRLRSMLWGFSWPAAAMGVAVFVVWLLLTGRGGAAEANAAFAANLSGVSVIAAGIWMCSRLVGSVVVSPIVEELAFRGYLLRRISHPDFEEVAYQNITPLAFVASSILFGLGHRHWLAGIVAGMILAAAARYRGKLSDAICAHATANAILSVYVIVTGSWSLWN